MKIVAILGSPRSKSNSSGLAYKIIDRTKELGADTEVFTLNKLQYKGCQACETCKTKLDQCVLKDELTQVLNSIHQADAVVMATPTYFGQVSRSRQVFSVYSFSRADRPEFTCRCVS